MKTSIKIKDFPTDERPRERLLKYGEDKLSNNELIALLIGSGNKHDSAIDLANRVLMNFEGLKLLRDATIEELMAIKGIGEAKGITLLAALELGKRIHTYRSNDRVSIKSPADGAKYVMDEMKHLQQEHLVTLFLNTKNQVIHQQTIFIGSLNSSIVHPREIYKEAIKRSAAAIICVHNHPSGDPTPSKEDIQVTRRLVETGKIVGIELLDHLIIGHNSYVSLKEKGYM